MRRRLYHDGPGSKLASHAHHPAAALLRRPGFLPRGARALLFQPLDLRRPRRSDSAAPATTSRATLGDESVIVTRDAVGRDSRAVQRLPPSRHAAVRADRRPFRRSHPVSVSPLDLRPRGTAARRAAHAARTSARTTTRCIAPAARCGTDTSSCTSGGGRIRPCQRPAAARPTRRSAATLRRLAHGRSPARPAHRVRRESELEADRPQLQRVPALPEPASGAEQAASLPRRRQRGADRDATAAARWGSGTASRR